MAIAETPERPPVRSRSNPRWLQVRERIVEFLLFLCGLLSILITVAIAFVVIYNALLFFMTENGRIMSTADIFTRIGEFFTSLRWTAGHRPAYYGIWALVSATLWVAVIAACISIPIGLATAIYLSEYAQPRLRCYAKPTLEILAGIPTVVYGFFAVMTITPFLEWFVPGIEPFNLLSAGIVVGIMIIPMVASLSEDSLRAVPKAMRDGAYALGATKFEVSTRVVVPAALSGIIASFILAISRAIGETMAVALAAGERPVFRLDPRKGAATMTGFIVSMAQGEEPQGTTNFNSMFAVAATLFFMTLAMNIIAQWMTRRFRQVYQ